MGFKAHSGGGDTRASQGHKRCGLSQVPAFQSTKRPGRSPAIPKQADNQVRVRMGGGGDIKRGQMGTRTLVKVGIQQAGQS